MLFLLLRIFILWFVISLHFVGGAILFRRLCSRDSVWFGFIIPPIALCLVLNFIEHFVGLPSLAWLLPFTSLGSIWLILKPGPRWNGLRLPTGIFLASFAFTLFIRALRPDIAGDHDGGNDCHLIANYLFGGTLPPIDTWLPPYRSVHYYTQMNYAASVLIRLFNVDVGTGYNLSCALLGAMTCFVAAAATWQLTRGHIIFTILAPFMIEAAATGSTAYSWLTSPNAIVQPVIGADIAEIYDDNPNNPITKFIAQVPCYDRRILFAPGYASWVGSFHDTPAGQFLGLLGTWALIELFRRKRANWPWTICFLLPFITVATCTWALPVSGLIFIGAIIGVLWTKIRPRNPRLVIGTIAFALVCDTPALSEFLTTTNNPGCIWATPNLEPSLPEFLVQWWPALLPWAALFFIWPRVPLAVRWIQIIAPILFIYVWLFNYEMRMGMTGKLWGFTYGIALLACYPVVAMQRAIPFRIITWLVFISSFLSFGYWTVFTYRTIPWEHEIFQLEGQGQMRWFDPKARILQALGQFHGETILTGKSFFAFYESALLATFSGNRAYVAWSNSEILYCNDCKGESMRREQAVNDIYDGKSDNPLRFLRAHNISAAVVWPGDTILPATIEKLKHQLAPAYDYLDYADPNGPTAGVFVYRPTLANVPGLSPEPFETSQPAQ